MTTGYTSALNFSLIELLDEKNFSGGAYSIGYHRLVKNSELPHGVASKLSGGLSFKWDDKQCGLLGIKPFAIQKLGIERYPNPDVDEDKAA